MQLNMKMVMEGKVGYLAEFNSTKKIFNSPKEKTTQEYISGKFG